MMFKDFLNSRLPIKSQAWAGDTTNPGYVEFGYGQVEPNHLSAQRTGQFYAQLPANPNISILEQGQFVKYDYAANNNGIGEVNFTGAGEWMLVYNEIKLYRDHPDGTKQWDCEFAMLKDDYQARIYTPYDWEMPEVEYHNGLYLNGKDELGNTSKTITQTVTINPDKATIDIAGTRYAVTSATANGVTTYTLNYNNNTYTSTTGEFTNVPVVYTYDDVTKDVEDIYEMGFTNDPWKKLGIYKEKKMNAGTSMVPRVFKTNVGDIFTTNMIANAKADVTVGKILVPDAANKGILTVKAANAIQAGDMQWQVVKVYTMPDGQAGVKVMRIA